MQLNKNINRNLLKEQSFPSYNINNNEDCILHFGIGNFHRAHLSWYLHRLMQKNLAKDWAIIGSGITKYDALPENAKKYIEFIEDFSDVPIKYISVGPERNQNIIR